MKNGTKNWEFRKENKFIKETYLWSIDFYIEVKLREYLTLENHGGGFSKLQNLKTGDILEFYTGDFAGFIQVNDFIPDSGMMRFLAVSTQPLSD